MNDVITWGALATALGSTSAIIGFWTRYSDRLTKADTKAVAAKEAAEDAKKDAKAAQDRVSLLDQAFGLYRERVALEYTSTKTLQAVETRLTDAIERLGDRFDRAIEHRIGHKGYHDEHN
jgi:biopolymer transport protein ExbB/TolQ